MSVFPNRLNNRFAEGVRRQDHGGIPAVHACKFYMFQHAPDHDGGLFGVANRTGITDTIDINLCRVFQKFINKHRTLRRGFHRKAHVLAQLSIGINDLHGPPPQDKAGTHQNRVAQFLGSLQSLLLVDRQTIGRLRNFQFVKHGRKELSIFSHFDAVGGSPDNVHPIFPQADGQIERCLPPKLDNRSPALLALVNMQDVFQGQRLKEKLVTGVIVRRDGLWVGIDHQGLDPLLLEGVGGVHAAIVKLDPLANAIGASPENHDLAFLGRADLIILTVIG